MHTPNNVEVSPIALSDNELETVAGGRPAADSTRFMQAISDAMKRFRTRPIMPSATSADRQEEQTMSDDNEVVELSDADLNEVAGGTTTVRDAHDRYSNTDRTGGGRH